MSTAEDLARAGRVIDAIVMLESMLTDQQTRENPINLGQDLFSEFSTLYYSFTQFSSMLGSDVTAPSTTSWVVFHQDGQSYNGETFDKGDILSGDNSRQNMWWDASAGILYFRYGTTVRLYMGADGKLYAGSGAVVVDENGILFNLPGVFQEFAVTGIGNDSAGSMQLTERYGLVYTSFEKFAALTVPNADFETGTTSGWTVTSLVSVNGNQKHSGAYSMEMQGGGSRNFISTNFINVAYAAAMLSFWIYSDAFVTVSIIPYDSGGNVLGSGQANYITSASGVTGRWVRYIIVGQYPTGTVKIKLKFAVNSVYACIDDIVLHDGYGYQLCQDQSGNAVIAGNLTVNGSNATTQFGDGSDGDVIIAADTTLTKVMNYRNLTINAGKTLYPAGFPVYVSGTLTNNGTIDCSGGAGGAGGGGTGAGGAGGAAPYTATTLPFIPFPSNGGQGEGSSGAGTANGAGKAAGVSTILRTLVPRGWRAGTGGGGGGAHGVSDTLGTAGGDVFSGAPGGAGGAATGSGSSNRRGGGGGAGGGVLEIYANVINNAGAIQANGGSGGNGNSSAGDLSGNGGGGGGGTVVVFYRSAIAVGTLSAAGGAAGTGGNGGVAGTAGVAVAHQI